MIKAVLLDLDETLLQNPPDIFAKAYIGLLIDYFQKQNPTLNQQQLQAAIRSATQATLLSTQALHFNAEVFSAVFAEQLGGHRAELDQIVEGFLNTTYPQLERLTKKVDAAVPLVDWLLSNNYAVAIATQPLYPQQAILQRVTWAGLDASRIGFISTLDSVHFAKPNPSYYEEILTRLGFEPDETLMVGDDWYNDIVPAATAGFYTYWIRPASTPAPAEWGDIVVNGSGTLADLRQAIQYESWLDTLTPRSLIPQQIAPRYLGNIAALHGLARDIPEHFWNQHPDPNEWSPLEIVVHLLESECDVQRPRLEMILSQENPFLVNPPTPLPPYRGDLADVNGYLVIEQFAAERLKTIVLLSGLTDEQWMRPARHSVFGPTNLLEMAAFTARHDRLHIKQLCQTLGKCL